MPDTLEVNEDRVDLKKRSWQMSEEASTSHEVKMLKHM
jgi:hypothetical protein